MDFVWTTDEIGPEKVVHIYESKSNLKAIVVIDNTSLGPAIGGVRMAADVTAEEVFRLARAMTFKNSAAGIPHGGGKSGIVADPKAKNKEALLRLFAQGIKNLVDYIPGPDMGTNEESMAIIYNEIKRSVGRPEEIGGIPLDELGATAYGVAVATDVAKDFIKMDLNGAGLVVQGFGSVGKHSARFLSERGVKLIAANDTHGTIYNKDGLDIDGLIKLKNEGKSVIDYKKGERLPVDDILKIECDIFVPAARPDVINEKNVNVVKTKLIVQGANIPVTVGAEKILHDKGILSIPDFIANAGGAIFTSVEYRNGTEKEAFEAVQTKITKNTRLVLEKVFKEKVYPRDAAEALAKERLFKAMRYRRSR
ncbi:MAG: Glu/Leu/Phe/Val dehydrogenase [Nitrospirota bacterium]|jgi:glutamate dehydrogenase (NAD(P)+)/glutamate dehydrogenase (NADP+)